MRPHTRRRLATAAALLLGGAAVGSAAPRAVDAPPSAVRVHPRGAMVTRGIAVDLPAGATTLRVERLPADALEGTVRAELAAAPEGTRVAGVLVDTVVAKPEPTAEDARLERRLEELRARDRELASKVEVARDGRERIAELDLSEPRTDDGRPATLAPATWKRNFERVRADLDRLAREIASLEWSQRELGRELAEVERRWAEAGSRRVERRRDVEVDLTAERAGRVELELRYFVRSAGWSPVHRVDVDRAAGVVELESFARVTQESGEAWRGVELTLSTALPTLEAGPPELESWRIRERPPERRASLAYGSTAPAVMFEDGIAEDLGFDTPDDGYSRGPVFSTGGARADRRAADEGFETDFFRAPSRYLGVPITIEVVDAPVTDVLRQIAGFTGKSFVIDQDVRGRVTLDLEEVPWDQALDLVLKSAGLGKEEDGKIVRIATMERLEGERGGMLEAIERAQRLDPVVLKIVPLNYASARDLVDGLQSIASDRPDASIDVDPRTNSLILKDSEVTVDVMVDYIRSLDMPAYEGQPTRVERQARSSSVRPEDPRRGADRRLGIEERLRPQRPLESDPLLPDLGGGLAEIHRYERRIFGQPLARAFDHLYAADAPLSLESGPEVRSVSLGRERLAARVRHEAVPLVRSDAFLVAEVSAARAAPLLAGPAEVTLDGVYLGRTRLPDAAPAEELEISLGIDPTVTVERRVDRSRADVGLVGDDVEDVARVIIEVRNDGAAPVRMHLVDRAPFTEDEDLELELSEIRPAALGVDAARDREWNVLTWELAVPPGERATAGYRLGITHARDLAVEERRRADLAVEGAR